MKIGDPVYRGEPVPLPVEVVWLIASYVGAGSGSGSGSGSGTSDEHHDDDHHHRRRLLSQTTLWACCLVSRAWYAASIEHLYNRPVLHRRNFDLFVRTMAPSPSSTSTPSRRTPRVGLASLIKHLDMSGLSYESSKSLTARLIRRMKDSLESFVAPAITFSIASLAPLSKCLHLRSLDLSSDYYDIELPQLLHAIAHLDRLTSLKLPCNGLWVEVNQQSRWPPNLQFLQITHRLYEAEADWAALFDSWPDPLQSLKVVDCLYYSSFACLWRCRSPARSIRRLDIGPGSHENGLPLGAIVHAFSGLTTLVLPAHVGAHTAPLSERDGYGNVAFSIPPVAQPLHPLETIVLRDYGHPSEPDLDDMVSVFTLYVDSFPRLRRIDLAEKYFNLAEDVQSFEALGKTLEGRADEADRDSAGIFLLDSSSA